MNLKTQKRLAADILGVGKNRVWIDPDRMDEVAEAITREEIRELIKEGTIRKRGEKGQKTSSREKGQGIGSRKGAKGARKDEKKVYAEKVRAQRNFIRKLRKENEISKEVYKDLYRKIKGGFFRSKKHIQIYLKKQGIME